MYLPLNSNFKLAFDFIKAFDFKNCIEGRHDTFEEDVFALVMDVEDINSYNNQENPKLEIHNKYIDIHFVAEGKEVIGWKSRVNCSFPEGHFNNEDDYQLFLDKPQFKVQAKTREFVIFYPEDAHAPLISTERLKKWS
ncbi:YhcH/YjgK/YiaL family protein [Vicingaceae bacterium]|nr:YhcH/YjgK/YiaL family protein [Vicingaceae bacterium]